MDAPVSAPTVEDFERRYAERSGVTVDELHRWGRFGEPCACGEDGCDGFAMGHQHDDAIVEDYLRWREYRDRMNDLPAHAPPA